MTSAIETDRWTDRLAIAALSRLWEPGDEELWAAVEANGAAAIWDDVQSRSPSCLVPKLHSALRARLAECRPEEDLRDVAAAGGRLVCAWDEEWPDSLEVLGAGAPLGLWVRGGPSLDDAVARSVSVVGSRAASAYGDHVASELGYDLGSRGWTVVSGGAYGIDGAAHRGALAAGGTTVAVLACGVDVAYPRGHQRLFDRIVGSGGLLVSEWPPGCAPRPHRFLVRNRVIAGITPGTVVVEAATRSGAMSTARRAAELGRQLMAVPGPVTSQLSTGCLQLFRDYGATAVANAAHVVEALGRFGSDLAPPMTGPETPRDLLGTVERLALEAVPVLRPVSAARLASTAGLALSETRRALASLILAGFVEQTDGGFRLGAEERARIRGARRNEAPD